MEIFLLIIVAISLLALGVYLDDRRSKRKEDCRITSIQQELKKRNFNATNDIKLESLYVATDLQKDEIIIVKYDYDNCKVSDVRQIHFHTTNFFCNGIKINENYCFIYPRNATLIYLDNEAKIMLILSSDDIDNPKRIKFADILSVELVLDSNVISKKSISDTISRSIVGSAIAGNVGALIGGMTSGSINQDVCKLLQCVVIIRNIQEPVININLCDCEKGIKDVKNSDVYKQAVLLMKTFTVIIDSCSQPSQDTDTRISSELARLFKLKEQNILTEEEFLTLKQRLINKKD